MTPHDERYAKSNPVPPDPPEPLDEAEAGEAGAERMTIAPLPIEEES